MKFFNTVIFSIFCCAATAQPIIHFDLNQSIGNEWGLGILEDIANENFSNPLTGVDITWDYTFIGELDNGLGVIFSEAELDDFALSIFKNIEGYSLEAGGTVQDSFPTGVGIIFEGEPNEEEGFVLGQNEDGIVRLNELEDDGNGFEIADTDSFLLYPFDLSYEENMEIIDVLEFSGSNTLDSIITIDTFTHIANGTLKMYYGDVSNAVLYRKTTKKISRTYNTDTGSLIFEALDYTTAYFFLQNVNLLPLIYYSFSSHPDWTPFSDEMFVYVYVPFFDVINKVEEVQIPFSLSLFPNPAQGRVVIKYDLEKVVPVDLNLYTSTGKKVLSKKAVNHSTGRQIEELLLPKFLPSGTYYLQLAAGERTGIQKVIIQR